VKICRRLELQAGAGARRIQENPPSRTKKAPADAEAFHKMLVSFGSLSEESPQGFAPGCMSQTTDRLLFDLPDALPRKIELPTDLFQRE